jgi:hypothetical protein
MSRYFSRLAQRSGFVPPMATAARRSSTAADIVVENSYVEGPPPAAGISSPSVTQPAEMKIFIPATKQQPSPEPTIKPALEESPSPLSATSAPTETATAPVSRGRGQREATASAADASSPRVVSATRGLIGSEPTLIVEHHREATSVASASSLPSRDVGITQQAEAARSIQRLGAKWATQRAVPVRVASEPLPLSSVGQASTTSLQLASKPMPRAPETTAKAPLYERQSAAINSYAPAVGPSAPAGQTPTATQSVEVRIGVVRLEIHAPAPAPNAPAPAPTPAREAPRFALRRHYLRG